MLSNVYVIGQVFNGRFVDVSTKQGIPFVKMNHISTQSEQVADPKGFFRIMEFGQYEFHHPLYKDTVLSIKKGKDTLYIELKEKKDFEITEKQHLLGKKILDNFHKHLPETRTTKFPEFDFLSATTIEVYEQSQKNPERWDLLNSLESLEKNRFKYPDKKYSRVVKSRYSDGDSSTLGYIPINTYTISEENEYINALDLMYYNPLFKGAGKRYEFALVDSFSTSEGTVKAVYFRPRPGKHFIALEGVLYFINDQSAGWGGYWMPHKKYRQDFTLTSYFARSSKTTRFLHELHVVLRLTNIPNYRRNSNVYYTVINTSPVFGTQTSSNKKWVDMAIFNYNKDTTEDDTWMMRQIVDKEKLEYIKKDTTEKKFVMSNTLKWMYNIYDGKIGYRANFFDINNEFAINKFESVRIGAGVQSHENLSDVFTFGGYFAYGIGDGEFKYGGNVGMYFGKARNNLLSFKYTKDVLEPAVVYYLDKRQDLVRDFFTSKMDEYRSIQASLRTKINPFLTSYLQFNDYSLRPLYDYIYNPSGEDIAEKQTFNFTEVSLLLNVGTPFPFNPNVRSILYRNKRIRSNLYLNITKGIDAVLGGNYDYWKYNGRIRSNIRVKKQGELDIVLDGGMMSKDQPYQINYGGPGTEFKLTGIIINNAFQSMKLYGFFADRYLHSFMNYRLENIFTKRRKFNPELAFALNVGWGKITGRKDIHELIEVRDYPSGYYEAGVLLNNLLRLKIYNYFYGGLGLGTFYGFGPDAENGAWALRISYEIGVL